MKKILLLFLRLVTAGNLCSQSLWDASPADNPFTFGVRAGMNFAHTDADCATSVHTGFHAGISVDYNIIKSFSLSSGLYYVGKGFRGNQNLAAVSEQTESSATAAYVQVPLLASWRIEAPSGVRFHVNVGPYFAYGLGGSAKYKPLDLTLTNYFDGDTFGDNGLLKKFDAGLSLGLMVQMSHVLIGASYELGLTDVGHQARFSKFHNRNVCLTLGYNL